MALKGSLIERLGELISRHTGSYAELEREVPVGGGSINDCYRLDTNLGRFFVKVNAADRHPSLFEAEADGLRRLRTAGVIRVPEVIALGEDHADAFLLMEHIDSGLKSEGFAMALGQGLARLHASTNPTFGLERDNYIGSLRQRNPPSDHWSAFYIAARLEPMVRLARDHGRLDDATMLRFERLFRRMEGLFPKEPPALLHGDLWSGNVLCDAAGGPVLIDPAVYYGHREMDIAMTKLFGGFDAPFYQGYNEQRPLEQGWENRIALAQLYPLLVHVNLFGGGYAQQVREALSKYL
ncbi:MAG: fructosamine kinase family protein [Flavobacteriales bacterium]|nr:fructosamine kinase family protein [Flavobacteriales bacterium]